jgi:hypothetical protein
VEGTLLKDRRRLGRAAAADPRSGAVVVEPRSFRAVVGAAEAAGLIVRVVEL